MSAELLGSDVVELEDLELVENELELNELALEDSSFSELPLFELELVVNELDLSSDDLLADEQPLVESGVIPGGALIAVGSRHGPLELEEVSTEKALEEIASAAAELAGLLLLLAGFGFSLTSIFRGVTLLSLLLYSNSSTISAAVAGI